MRDQTPKRPRRLAAAAAITLAMALALGAGGARAEDDDENVPLDTKLWRQFMKDIGLQRDGEAMIDYRERAPLAASCDWRFETSWACSPEPPQRLLSARPRPLAGAISSVLNAPA